MELGKFQVDRLSNRREAAVAAYTLKLLNGKTKPLLKKFTPEVVEVEGSRTRSGGLQIKSVISTHSLDKYRRSFFGALPGIWYTIPQKIMIDGCKHGRLKIRSKVKKFLINHC